MQMEQFREWWQTILDVFAHWVTSVSTHPVVVWAWAWVGWGGAEFWQIPALWRWAGLGAVLTVVVVRWWWHWARRMVTQRHLHVQVELWRAVLALIHAGRDVDVRGMGPVDMARRELKGVFFRNQMFVVADVGVRKEMRTLIEQADDDALRFVQRPEFSHLYRLQTLVEAQIRQQPGWVRTLQWITSDVWYQLWRRRRLR
jgi:hypothetical protein